MPRYEEGPKINYAGSGHRPNEDSEREDVTAVAEELMHAESVPTEDGIEAPFERAFPPSGAAELTRSYRAALERAIQDEKARRKKAA